MTNFEIQEAVINKVHSLIKKYEESFKKLKEFPVIKFNKKGKIAGTFSWGNNKPLELNFNMVLLKENFEKFLESTVTHEVAHLLSYDYNGIVYTRNGNISHHGKEWKKMMAFLGVDAKRCHSYCVKNVIQKSRTRRWSYTCTCGFDHQIATVTHNRIQRGQRSYSCKHCGGKLVYKS